MIYIMNFYGHTEILELLNKRTDSLSEGYRQNIAIIGEKRIGKTCLLEHWLSNYCNNFILPLYIELNTAELNMFLKKFTGTLLYSFLKNSGIPLIDDIDFLLEKAERYIPETVMQSRQLLADTKKNKTERFIKIFEISETFYCETSKRCCIIFDEFHRLNDLKLKDLYTHWRKSIMLHKNTMLILASSDKYAANQILSNDLNLLFGNFHKVELEPLDIKSAQGLIRSNLKNINCEQILIDFIIEFGSQRPFYLHTLSNSFSAFLIKNKHIKPSIHSFILSIEDIFLEEWGTLYAIFIDTIKLVQVRIKEPLPLQVMLALSKGFNRPQDILNYLHKPKKDIGLALNGLADLGVIIKTPGLNLISDRIFGFWLKCIYAAHQDSFGAVSNRQKENLHYQIEKLFNEFCQAQKKAVTERIVDLFYQFSDESITVQKKPLRLAHFKEVKLFNTNNTKIHQGILGRAKKSLWIAGLKEGSIEEEDVSEFLLLCKKFKQYKQQQRILITLDGIDMNARLIAKKEKIITWDICCINSLFEIYGKPKIVK